MQKLALSHYFSRAIKRVLPHHCPLCNGVQALGKNTVQPSSSSLRYQRYSHGLNSQYSLITNSPLNANSRLSPLAQFVNKREHGHSYFCEQCFDSLPTIAYSCDICDLPLAHTEAHSATKPLQARPYLHLDKSLCPECQSHNPAFDRVICAYQYDPVIASIISKFKQHGDIHCGTALSRGLIDRLWLEPAAQSATADATKPSTSYLQSFDALVPVPIHWRTKLKRGFNQSEWIASTIAQYSKTKILNLLKKSALSPEQKKLNRKQRETNVKASIQAKRYVGIPKRIALIDDVVTTGATANSIANHLKNLGAERVDVWALARTPK